MLPKDGNVCDYFYDYCLYRALVVNLTLKRDMREHRVSLFELSMEISPGKFSPNWGSMIVIIQWWQQHHLRMLLKKRKVIFVLVLCF